MTRENKAADASLSQKLDPLQLLASALKQQWKSFRKKLQRCQAEFSERTVHSSRVAARRLVATLDLLETFLPRRDLKKCRRALKAYLDSFDELRDTQVQLLAIRRMIGTFPVACELEAALVDRERRISKRMAKEVKLAGTKRLGDRITGFVLFLSELSTTANPAKTRTASLAAVDRAFSRIIARRRCIVPGSAATFHRTRVAFKKFRYMVEVLQPLLPELNKQQFEAMRHYQNRLGAVQDSWVFLHNFDQFVRKAKLKPIDAQPVRGKLGRRHVRFVQRAFGGLDELNTFWHLPRA